MIKKVAIFCDFFNFLGGTEYYNFMLASSLKKRGIEVKVFIGERPKYKYWTNLLKENDIKFFYPRKRHKDLNSREIEKEFIKDVVEILKQWSPDIIHSNPPGKMLVSYFECCNLNIPIVATEWTTPAENTSHWYPPELKKYVNMIDVFIATCEEVKKGILDYHKYKGEILMLPHLIYESHTLEYNQENIWSVGVISRLSPEKGLDFLLGSWFKVQKIYPNAILHIYGHGNDEEHLKNLAKALGIEKNIVFEGIYKPVTGIDDISKKHMIFIQPSLFESIPTSIIELMARRKIIIATNVGGIGELINNNLHDGFLVEPASTNSLFDALNKIFSNPEKYSNFKENAYKIYKQRYDLNKTIDKLISCYECICKRRKYD